MASKKVQTFFDLTESIIKPSIFWQKFGANLEVENSDLASRKVETFN